MEGGREVGKNEEKGRGNRRRRLKKRKEKI